MENIRSKTIKYLHFESVKQNERESSVALERIVTLEVNGQAWMDIYCLPCQLDFLMAGFLFNEGLISSKDELIQVHVCKSGEYVEVITTQPITQPSFWKKTSGCSGGITAVDAAKSFQDSPILKDIHLSPDRVYCLLQKFMTTQRDLLESGGVHSSAISDGNELIFMADDIGRHNTLDKLAGYCLYNEISLPQPVILTSGRISSEMLQKSSRMGASVIISLTATNDYSIQLANRWNITLIGYSRMNSFRVFSHPERIIMDK